MYTDASFGNLNNGGSQGGFVILLTDDNHKCLATWRSLKLRRVVKSTFAAETLALVDGAEAAVYFQSILNEIGGYDLPIKCYTDNASLIESIRSTKAIQDRRLRIDIAVLREMVQNGEITVDWVATGNQMANCLTKRDADAKKFVSAFMKQD